MILTGECLKNNSSSVSIPIATIVGIIIALLVFIAMIIIAIVLLLKYKRKRQSSDDKNVIKIEPFPSKNDNENVYTEIAPPNYSFRANATIADTVASSNYIIKMSKLKIKKKIGEGAFGCVYLGIFNKTEVAIKKLSKTNISDVDIKAFIAEAELMRNLPPHPNVVLFRGVTVPPDPLSIVTDYCNGGTLSEYLKNHPNLPISEKLQFIKDIAKGMLHLHCGIPGKEVIHRDLAARNILLKNGVALITDFGLSRVKSSLDDYQKTQNNVGPLKWMSPESLFENKYSTKSDVFSFGVVIYEIIAQEPPWKDLSGVQAAGKVNNGYRMVLPESCPCPLVLKKLMVKCWAQLPSDRPDFEKICDILENLD